MTTPMETLMDTNAPTRWTKTTEQSGVMVIELDNNVLADLKTVDLEQLLTDQGWTREPDPAAFDRRSVCACTTVAVEDDDAPVETGGMSHHCILCCKIPAQS